LEDKIISGGRRTKARLDRPESLFHVNHGGAGKKKSKRVLFLWWSLGDSEAGELTAYEPLGWYWEAWGPSVGRRERSRAIRIEHHQKLKDVEER